MLLLSFRGRCNVPGCQLPTAVSIEKKELTNERKHLFSPNESNDFMLD